MSTTHTSRRGFTLIEILIVVGIGAILAGFTMVSLFGKRNVDSLNATVRQMATTLREAQSRAVAQSSSTDWGVAFLNLTSDDPSYDLFAGQDPATPGARAAKNALPTGVTYTIPQSNESSSIVFQQLTGAPLAQNFQIIVSMADEPNNSSTITVYPTGAIAYEILSCIDPGNCVKQTVFLPGFEGGQGQGNQTIPGNPPGGGGGRLR